MNRTLPAVTLLLATVTVPAVAAAQIRAVPEQPASAAAAANGVDIFIVNEGDSPQPMTLPQTMTVTSANGDTVTLHAPDLPPQTLAAGRFARVRYTLEQDQAPLLADAAPPPADHAPNPPAPGEATIETATGSHSGFLARFEPHEPIYGVAGLGDAGAKLQFSFGFRPFEGAGALDGLRFAYTQTMFWGINLDSVPFTSTTYSPEIYYEIAPSPSLRLAAGYRHDSNGEVRATSVGLNRLFVRAAKHFDLGSDWYVDVAPEAWVYIATEHPRRSIARYRGYTGLRVAVGQVDGIKIAGHLTGNPGTGKAAGEVFASYPIGKIDDSLGIYIFGQAYTGYGEALDDYDRRDTHARIGISFTR